MRLVCISDTHGYQIDVPDGDVLIHAGDLTGNGSLEEIAGTHAWLAGLPHEHKVVIAGNHDFGFQREASAARALMTQVTYLQDEAIEIDGVRFWGSPWQPRFFDWAFNLSRGAPLRAVWDRIPSDTDVLVTHGPPMGILDETVEGDAVGCEELLMALERVQPRVHVFGHIHEGYGRLERDATSYVNASTCTVHYAPTNPPLVLDLYRAR